MVFILWKYLFFLIIRLEFKHGGKFHRHILMQGKDDNSYILCQNVALNVLICQRNIHVITLHLVYFVVIFLLFVFTCFTFFHLIWWIYFRSCFPKAKWKWEILSAFEVNLTCWNCAQDIKIQLSAARCVLCPWMAVWICCSDSFASDH